MGFIYLVGLAISLTGMVVLDRRFGLFFWQDARRASVVFVVGLALFLIWDVIGLGIVAYDPAHLSGIRIGLAPIEDFAYAVAAGLGLPALWLLLPSSRQGRTT